MLESHTLHRLLILRSAIKLGASLVIRVRWSHFGRSLRHCNRFGALDYALFSFTHWISPRLHRLAFLPDHFSYGWFRNRILFVRTIVIIILQVVSQLIVLNLSLHLLLPILLLGIFNQFLQSLYFLSLEFILLTAYVQIALLSLVFIEDLFFFTKQFLVIVFVSLKFLVLLLKVVL